jgi:Zn-dependent protease/CBS domain-containing protein
MHGSLHLGKIAGISLEMNYSWLVVFVLLTVSLAIGWFPAVIPGLSLSTYWVLGVIATLLLFVSVLAHEFAHSLVARARGLPVKSITLFIFGGVSDLEKEPRSPGVEFQVTIVGPLTSLIVGVICWLVHLSLLGVSLPAAALFGYLAITNVLLTIFNLIPGFPLDGGRVLRSVLWKITGNLRKATRWATQVSRIIAWLFILGGIWLFFTVSFLSGLWLGFIGWFLLSTAEAANAQVQMESLFGRTTASEVMTPVSATVSPDCSLQRLVDEYLLPHALRVLPVMDEDRLIGLISLTDIRQVPREQWSYAQVGRAMVPRSRLHVAAPQQRLDEVLSLMGRYRIHQVPVVQNERLVGMVNRETIVRFLEVRRSLGMEEAEQRVDEHLGSAA